MDSWCRPLHVGATGPDTATNVEFSIQRSACDGSILLWIDDPVFGPEGSLRIWHSFLGGASILHQQRRLTKEEVRYVSLPTGSRPSWAFALGGCEGSGRHRPRSCQILE